MPSFNDLLHAVQTGFQVAGQVQGQHNAGGGQTPGNPCARSHMVDSGQIAGCIDYLANQYHQIEASGATVDQLLQAATAILAELNNDARFAQNSNDAYLAQAKAVMAHTIQILRAGGGSTGLTTVDPVTGRAIIIGQPSIIAGVSNTTLMIGAGVAFIGIMYIMKK